MLIALCSGFLIKESFSEVHFAKLILIRIKFEGKNIYA